MVQRRIWASLEKAPFLQTRSPPPWNHAPKMWAAMEERQMPLAGLTQSDIANLYAHFYALRYFDPKGTPRTVEGLRSQGLHRLPRRRCGGRREEPQRRSDHRQVGDHARPSSVGRGMWNHSANMSAQFAAKGVEWPQFSLQEMVDLLAYVESQPAHAGNLPYLRLGDWQAGEQAFADLGCSTCHSLGATEAGKVDLLAEAQRQPLLSGLAVDMWNHRPQMEAQAKSKGVDLKPFEADQMANVTAYLFRRGYFQEQGDAKRGAEVYATKECASCHDKGEAGAPKLNALTAVDLASAIWTHGPNMKAQMDYLEKDWPELSAADVANLVAYVQSR
ncbi:MAG: cytochrome c [Bryobacterales bacterium]